MSTLYNISLETYRFWEEQFLEGTRRRRLAFGPCEIFELSDALKTWKRFCIDKYGPGFGVAQRDAHNEVLRRYYRDWSSLNP